MPALLLSDVPGRFDRVRSALTLTSFNSLLLFANLLLSEPAWAVHRVGNIELDGNTLNDGAAVPGIDDWDDVFNATHHALRASFIFDTAGPDPTSFSGGVKDTQTLDKWTCTRSPVQAKSNILHAYGATYESDGDLMFYAGADRESDLGNSNMGVWLFQGPVSCVSNGGAVPFSGTHLDGDLLLVAEFDQGGRVEQVLIYRWSDPDGIPQNGDECVGGDNGDCSDVGVPAFIGQNCNDSPAGDGSCGRTNPASSINAAWRNGIPRQGFYEVGINLSRLIGDIGCFANAVVETRSSTSLTATLKDFVILDIPTCATLEVQKATSGGDADFGFTVEPSAGGPDAFELSNGGHQVFPTVGPGSYTVSEAIMPPGPAAPVGWNLTDISCIGGTSGAPVYVNGGHDGGNIVVEVGLDDDAVCSFTNSYTAPSGSITIQKVCQSEEPGPASFGFFLGGFAGSSTTACVDGEETLACGESITCLGLGAGSYQVDELALPMAWKLTDVSCTGPASCSVGPSPQAQIDLVGGDSAVVTFTNTQNASIEICKSTLPAASGGEFDFSGGLGSFSLADGECQGPISVAPGVAVEIVEAGKAGFLLESVNCSGSNWVADPTGTLTVTPHPGEAVGCIFLNTQEPGDIRLCKDTVAPSGADPAFEFELSGPDPALPVSTSLTNGVCDLGAGDPDPHLLVPGVGYAVSETPAPGWSTEVSCVGSEGAEDPANIDLSPAETVTCTFTNTEGVPGIALDKTGAIDLRGDGIANPGDPVNYLFEVTNTGDVSLVDVTISDAKVAIAGCPSGHPIPMLQPGESVTCSGSYAVTQADIDAGVVVNTASVSGACPLLNCPVEDQDGHSEPIPQQPGVAIAKTTSPNTYSSVGEVITYHFAVSNTGNVSLNNVLLSDPLPGLSTIDCPGGNPVPVLPVGMMVHCSASYVVTRADIDAGMVANTATVVAECPADTYSSICASHEDDEIINVVRVNLAKSVNGTAILEGDGTYTVVYTITAINLGGGPALYDLVDAFSPGSGVVLNTVNVSYLPGTENSQTGVLGAYPVFVTDENLGDGLDESWLVTANFLVDPTQVADEDRDCDPGAPVSGTGFYNAVSGSDSDVDPADNDSCTGLPPPVIDLAKDVAGITVNGDGSFTVTYTIVASNLGEGPGMYNLVDTIDSGSGIVVVAAELLGYVAGSENSQTGVLAPPGSFPVPFGSGDVLVAGETLGGLRDERWTIAVTFEIDSFQVGNGFTCAGPGTGTYNSVSGSETDPDPSNDSDCINPPQAETAFRVRKDFEDDNPAGVTVSLSCNTGLPLQQSKVIRDFEATGDDVSFVIGAFEPGTMNCSVTEAEPVGYTPGYVAGASKGSAIDISHDAEGCHFEGVAGGQFTCDVVNTLKPVRVVVEKEWIDENPDFGLPLLVEATLECEDEIVGGMEQNGIWTSRQFIDPSSAGQWNVVPHFGGTLCSVSERPEPGVIADTNDCEGLIVRPGTGDRCVIVNTRLYEGIPALDRYGLLILAMVLLSTAVVAYRRFV